MIVNKLMLMLVNVVRRWSTTCKINVSLADGHLFEDSCQCCHLPASMIQALNAVCCCCRQPNEQNEQNEQN